jgi:hypothetical protein
MNKNTKIVTLPPNLQIFLFIGWTTEKEDSEKGRGGGPGKVLNFGLLAEGRLVMVLVGVLRGKLQCPSIHFALVHSCHAP